MNAGELGDLLARLPADMLICVSGAGVGAYHVVEVDKQPRKRAEKVSFVDGERVPAAWRGKRTLIFPGDGSYQTGPAVILRAGSPWASHVWWEPEPDWTVRGRWPKALELDEVLRRDAP